MTYGILDVSVGPMFSGKTTSLLKNLLISKTLFGKNCVVFKPSFDNRYSEIEIVSHDGLKTAAYSVSSVQQMAAVVANIPYLDSVFMDEIQFFTEPNFEGNLVLFVKSLLTQGIDVWCVGLDMDWRGDPFEVSAKLCAMAETDSVHKLKANCTVCGLPAGKTFKISQSGGSVELGAIDKYEARCNKHWSPPKGS